MLFPWAAAAVAPPAELPVGAFAGPAGEAGSAFASAGAGAPEAVGVAAEGTFDGSAVAAGCAVAGAGEDDDAEAGGVAAAPADVPPRLVTYETRAFISAAFTVSATMPAAFIFAVGAFRSAVNLAGGY
jgi:hypothetical protein